MGDSPIKLVEERIFIMESNDKNKAGVHRPIICRKCGHKVGFLRMTPALKDILDKKNRKQTWAVIFLIALITQLISQILSDLFLGSIGMK